MKQANLTRHILVGMIIGGLLGAAMNTWLTDIPAIDTYVVDGLFKIIGGLFIASLKMIVVPLVTFSLIAGVCNIGDVNTLGRVGIKSLLLYLFTTALAISLALSLASVIQPGSGFIMDLGQVAQFQPKTPPSFSDVLISLVPSNPVAAFAQGEMLQIILFSILFGICILMTGEMGAPLISTVERLNEVMMRMVLLIMSLAPIGVFCLIARTFYQQGIELILPMIGYFGTVIATLIIHAAVSYSGLLLILARLNPALFFRKIRNAQLFAFSTASSNATIPITLRTTEYRLGARNSIASFTVPLGATINMDGTAIMQGVASVFIANVYGIDLSLSAYMTIVGMAVLASIGTAGVPGVGLIMLAMVLNQVNLPVEGIALIIGVDRLLDMLRTAVNITGDAAVTCVVAKSEGALDLGTYQNPNVLLDQEVHLPHEKT
ncbi:MAG TPA: dicarboxylate/amino acid:cation symporter [Gammaproteobacteria bacterium]|nr:dicarboxylate/amino acid:cation symporter [Gammaproteobacteria bacterium]